MHLSFSLFLSSAYVESFKITPVLRFVILEELHSCHSRAEGNPVFDTAVLDSRLRGNDKYEVKESVFKEV